MPLATGRVQATYVGPPGQQVSCSACKGPLRVDWTLFEPRGFHAKSGKNTECARHIANPTRQLRPARAIQCTSHWQNCFASARQVLGRCVFQLRRARKHLFHCAARALYQGPRRRQGELSICLGCCARAIESPPGPAQPSLRKQQNYGDLCLSRGNREPGACVDGKTPRCLPQAELRAHLHRCQPTDRRLFRRAVHGDARRQQRWANVRPGRLL